MLRIPKGRAPWLTARHLFFNNLTVRKTASVLHTVVNAMPKALPY
jgi:hypothetical protein